MSERRGSWAAALAGALLLLALASGCGAEPSPGTGGPAATGRPDGLRVSGDRLVNDRGQTVLLHGVDMSGTEYACAQNHSDDPFGGQPEDSPETMAAMRAWHIDAVRIPLNEDCWLGINGVRIGGAVYQQAVEALVARLEASGFYVILDLHWSAPGGQRALSQNPLPDEDHSPAFWASVAAAFRRNRNVVFDLFNEPHLSGFGPQSKAGWACLWQGCTLGKYATGGTPSLVDARWRTAGMDQLIARVRRSGARNLILVAGLDWANDLSGWRNLAPRGDNLAASWHSYLDNRCSTAACWNREVAPLARHVPVLVTETGDSASPPLTYLPRLLPWLDRHHLGYLAWTWNAWDQQNNVLVTDMATGAPTPGEGVYYRAHLLELWRQRRRG